MPPRSRPRCATTWVHYPTCCNTQSSAPEDGQKIAQNMLSWLEVSIKLLLLHLVGYLHYLTITVKCALSARICRFWISQWRVSCTEYLVTETVKAACASYIAASALQNTGFLCLSDMYYWLLHPATLLCVCVCVCVYSELSGPSEYKKRVNKNWQLTVVR